MNKRIIIGWIASLVLLSACDGKSKDGTIERATTEQEAARDVDNKNQKQKAEVMEANLAAQHKLFAALEGEFEGPMIVNRSPARTKLIMSRNLPEWKGGRVRQLSEIEYDLNNLRLNVQAILWDPSNSGTTIGCSYSLVKPDFNVGYIELGPSNSAECKFAYRIFLNVGGLPDQELRNLNPTSPGWVDLRAHAQEVAQGLTRGDRNRIDDFVGAIQPNFNASSFNFSIKRTR